MRFARLCRPAEPAAELGPRGMRRLVVGELPAREDLLHERKSRGGTFAHGDGRRAVQLDHGRRLDLEQQVVGRDDAVPVGRRGGCGLGVGGADGRLQV